MNQKELIRKHIEEERKRLNCLVEKGGSAEEIYRQSVAVDHLIEQYLDQE